MSNTLFNYQIFILIFGGLECAVFLLIFAGKLQKRSHFLIRLFAYLAVELMIYVGIVYAICRIWLSDWSVDILTQTGILYSLLQFVFGTGMMFFCFSADLGSILYTIVVSRSMLNVASATYAIVMLLTGSYPIYVLLIDKGDIYTWLFYVIIYALGISITYRVFVKNFHEIERELGKRMNHSLLYLFFFMLLAMLICEGGLPLYGGLENPVRMIIYMMRILFSSTVLLIEKFIFTWIEAQKDHQRMLAAHESYKQQAERNLANMEAVNIKCHDLKHQIRNMMQQNHLDENFIQEVQDTISIYDTNIATGNEYLDMVLREKNATCEAAWIEMSVMVNGAAFSFMKVSDINSFFGNAIDNAIEYLKTVDKKNRFVRLSTREKNGVLTVRIENYCENQVRFDEKGFPITSKKDVSNHGFGVRSMKQVTRKYDGIFSIKTEGNLFVVVASFYTN